MVGCEGLRGTVYDHRSFTAELSLDENKWFALYKSPFWVLTFNAIFPLWGLANIAWAAYKWRAQVILAREALSLLSVQQSIYFFEIFANLLRVGYLLAKGLYGRSSEICRLLPSAVYRQH
jgi:hypothetical protein